MNVVSPSPKVPHILSPLPDQVPLPSGRLPGEIIATKFSQQQVRVFSFFVLHLVNIYVRVKTYIPKPTGFRFVVCACVAERLL